MSWFQKLFGRKSSEAKPLPANDAYDEVAEIGALSERLVQAGFMSREEIVDAALDYVDAAGNPDLRRIAERTTDEALERHSSAQATWTETTDCDRLDAAFAALEVDGVISRQDFTCCGTCGSAEIWDQIEDAKSAGRPARGYAFYHQQDTESAVEGDGVYLNYGACEEGDDASLAIAREIVSKLNEHGLETHWDGKLSRRINVSLDWRKRRIA